MTSEERAHAKSLQEEPREGAPEEQIAPEGAAAEGALEEINQKLAEAQARADEYLDQWRRTAAEFSNYKKRVERERGEFYKTAVAEFVLKLLPIIDDLDRAFENLPAPLENEEWVDGIRLVRQKLARLLDQVQVEPIPCENASFDPALHEALTYEESDTHEEGEIIGVTQKGYRMGDRVIRPALVRVAKRTDSRGNSTS